MAENKISQDNPETKAVADKKSDKDVKKEKKKKPSVFSRFKGWLRTYKSEMKKVVWSSPKQVLHNTTLVLVCIVVISAVIGALDLVFNQAILGLTKLF